MDGTTKHTTKDDKATCEGAPSAVVEISESSGLEMGLEEPKILVQFPCQLGKEIRGNHIA